MASRLNNTRTSSHGTDRRSLAQGFNFERLEPRRLFSVKLYGITGNQQNASYPDETLFSIDYTTTPGTLGLTNLKKLPYVPDTDAIGYNPENGLLYHTSGASSYRNDPTRIGYHDDQFMETVDVRSPQLTQAGVFNANYEGDPLAGSGNYGLPAPFPTWLSPSTRRTDEQTDGATYGVRGPNEYSSARDLTWSPDAHLFYIAASEGIYTLTADGATATFLGNPTPGSGGPKGITFATVGGRRRLLVSQRDGGTIYILNPSTLDLLGNIVVQEPTGTAPGILSLVEDTDGSLIAIAKSVANPDNAFGRDLIRINTVTGEASVLGTFNVHMADLAIVHDATANVTGQRLFYNNSVEDGATAGADAQDDAAVDYTKTPLPPATQFGAANLTSYGKGLNGVMIDVSGTPTGTLLPSDFAIRSAPSSAPNAWATGPTPASITVRRGAGVGGTDRVTLIWADYNINNDPPNEAIANGWLEVTMLATANTKLTAPSVFRYGNLIGDLNGNGTVNTADYGVFRQRFGQPADDSGADLNHDGTVNTLDYALFRSTFGKALAAPPALLIGISARVLGGATDEDEKDRA